VSIAVALVDSLRTAVEPPPYNPDDTTDLIGLALIYGFPSLIAAIAGTATAVITVRGQRKGKFRRDEDRAVLDEVKKKVDVVRDEVKNDHPDNQNLRDQVDRMETMLASLTSNVTDIRERQIDHGRDIGGIRDDVGGLRGELRDERSNRRDLETRINGFIRREHPGADPL
jgi:predicted RNase H-like nuclease (RuvC/YqgF family)